ncbi:MarR family winged helix-turn-helix transcriptional regulator [Rhodococcoides corynebacterioides]|uniref:MarR family transcriptional regulator n=1 Tax=Rhodococcoides corynebacterioides TaxID=53972 RepID=A0ABS7PB55_9NOCA|nr:MarR family transcriptional regulator [Rhodococcus corynebacterioides]MBY6368376.1 MarR family transcriptional regulator [Rhodococcus corynebacterioides]MBY6407569.1 MarR family transcriptional regulator [Rhodococcus corynebacterioides]
MANWLTDDEQRAWRAYLDSTRLLLQTLDRQLVRESGISFTDFELLVKLSEAPGRSMRMRDLADAVTTTRSGVTRAITRLVDAGWVVRVECEDDRRGMSAELTDAGMEKLAATSPGHVDAVRESMFDVLSDDDVDALGRIYSDMRAHLQTTARH